MRVYVEVAVHVPGVTDVFHYHLPEHLQQDVAAGQLVEVPFGAQQVQGILIRRVDTPSILFFLGILLAVASLQTTGLLSQFAVVLSDTFGSIYLINIIIGLVSSIVDNVPLVAGAMGMYSLDTFPPDNDFWELLAYCAGTGGSALIIGSAAGVAMMGILKIDFVCGFNQPPDFGEFQNFT